MNTQTFTRGDKVYALQSPEFAGYEGTVVRLERMRGNLYIHVEFPSHRWHYEGRTWDFKPEDLRLRP